MMYLLDADTLIKAANIYYPAKRFPVFWEWLVYQGEIGTIKVPIEQVEEVTAGTDELAGWLRTVEIKQALELGDEISPEIVSQITDEGYADDLNEAELITIGRDPFLIAHAFTDPVNRTVVTFEVSKPSKQRQNRKVPDVCSDLGVLSADLFEVLDKLDFTTDWVCP